MSNEITEFERKFEDIDERTLAEMLPSSVSERLKAIPQDFWDLTEEELIRHGNSGPLESKLRIAFWLEVERAKRTNNTMAMANVFGGICSKIYFHKSIVGNSYKLAFICSPPIEVQIALEELLVFGMNQLREVLALPNVDAKGRADTRLIDSKRKIVEDAANRRRGHVLRKTEVNTKSVNLNLHQEVQGNPIVDIDARIAELETPLLPTSSETLDIIDQVRTIDVEKEELQPVE